MHHSMQGPKILRTDHIIQPIEASQYLAVDLQFFPSPLSGFRV
jgi:hypothetical protein